MGFGKNLKKYRKLAGLTQAEVADHLGINRRSYLAYETGDSFPKDPVRLMELSEILNVDVEALMNDKDGDDDKKLFSIAGTLAYTMRTSNTSGAARDAVIKYLQQVYWECKKLNKADKIEMGMNIIKEYDDCGEEVQTVPEQRRIYIWGTAEAMHDFSLIRRELERGILRQGWGREGMDIRRPYEEVEKIWYLNGWPLRECAWRYEKFRKMLDIKKNDIIIIKNVEIASLDRVPCCFTLARCKQTYNFEVEPSSGDFGHMIGVELIRSVYLTGEEDPLYKEIWPKRGPHGRAFDVLDENWDEKIIASINSILNDIEN